MEENLTRSDSLTNNDEYQNLLARFQDSDAFNSDEFIIIEALKMYSKLESDNYDLKIRLLELLKGARF